MSFSLDKVAESFHLEVRGQANQKPFSFVGRFTAFATEEEINEIMNRISDAKAMEETAEQEGGPTAALIDCASQLLQGWVNPPDQPHLWITQNGQAVESTPEGVADLLQRTGVALAVCLTYQEQRFSRQAQAGNSQSSRGNGFKAPPKTLQTSPT